MMSFTIRAHRVDEHLSQAANEHTSVSLGTDMAGNTDALNPMELLMAAVAACMIKGTNRVVPLLALDVRSIEITLTAIRQDAPPAVERIDYEIVVDSPDSDEKLALLHENLLKFGTVTNTVAAGTTLQGTLTRR